MRDPAGLFLTGADAMPDVGPADAAWILRRVLSPEGQVEGIDARLGDPMVLERGSRAKGFVMLLPPVGNLSNPFYRVHGRRNDRFVAPNQSLRRLFPEIDFTDFVFTGHLLEVLIATCAVRFGVLARTLQSIWLERLKQHLAQLPDRGVMLHLPAQSAIPMPIDDVLALCGGRQSVVPVDPVGFTDSAAVLARALSVTQTGVERAAG